MTLSVKRIKNRFYVYDQRKKEGKVTMKYIGPLDRIIGLHQVVNYQKQNEVIDNVLNTDQREVVNFNYPMQDEVIDSLVRMFSRVVVNLWCGGWGLNPRRPTPPGPEPGPFDLARAPPHTWRRGRDLNPRAPRRGSGSLWLGG